MVVSKFILIISLFFFLIFHFNYNQIQPTEKEIVELNFFYDSLITIDKEEKIIALQNYTIDNISHYSNGIDEIDIIKILKTRKGQCFDRSLILQKIMLLNSIEVRPVFVYSNLEQKTTQILDFFSTTIHTHNIFEFYWNRKWYVMDTNEKMKKLKTLDEFFAEQTYFKNETRYVRYLNNRNGRFIYPGWIPDIY